MLRFLLCRLGWHHEKKWDIEECTWYCADCLSDVDDWL